MIGPSSTQELPSISSEYNDRLGRIYSEKTLEGNWYESRLQHAADESALQPQASRVLRPEEADLGVVPRIARDPATFRSRAVVSDGFNESLAMSKTFFAPIDERPANPVGDGKPTDRDAQVQRLSQADTPKFRYNKDRMSNVCNEVRPLADSDAKVRRSMITAETTRHLNTHGLWSDGNHAVSGTAETLESTTAEAMSTGRNPRFLEVRRSPRAGRGTCAFTSVSHPGAQKHQRPPPTSSNRPAFFSTGGYESSATNHTAFSFGAAKEANARLPGLGRESFGKTSITKLLDRP